MRFFYKKKDSSNSLSELREILLALGKTTLFWRALRVRACQNRPHNEAYRIDDKRNSNSVLCSEHEGNNTRKVKR